ncbi:Por secretion system C-terminal sorting domain-containing protein [Dyadobacter soli]|uniref:Por secretion system C-terminal sorting domain-containing protein n=1 Tax=Dyadobacter soli TaxID=659014 RepID=A0A1G6VNE7_9BACT|nr:T9SS type A sorting domain-containing protein [Dyadobacter soli]SDD55170.1 Por secretion system C-terminal sorting domain-containing protein [Dyadobacter soli]
MKTFYGRKPGVRGAKRWIAFASLFALAGSAYSLTRPINWRPLVTELSRTLPEPLQQLLPQQKKTIEPQAAPDPTRTMAPQGAFPLQRGMALVSRLSNPNAGAPGQGSDRKGFVLGVYDARNPGGNSAPAALGNWNDVSNTIFRHPDWTNAKMGEVFGIEIDNSVPATPQVFVGSTGTFVGYINGSAEYAGRTIPAAGSEGGDVFRVDGNTGNVSTITNAIPSTGYHTSGGRGASAMTVPLNTTAGRVKTVAIVNGGTGYALFDPLVFTGGTGTGAAGYVTVTAGVITGIVVTNQGTGYGPGPLTVSVTSAGGGTGFTGTVTMGYPLQTGIIVPTSGGAGYPFLGATIMGDGVGGGVSTAFTTGSLTQYNITVAGLDYTYAPTVTINNRYTGVGNIGYNYAKKVVYTASLDNGNIYAIDATTGTFLGVPFNHQPGIADPSLAVTDLRRLAVGMAWNPRDNRLYFSRPDAVGYTTSGTSYNYTHNEVVSIGLNADGSINTSDVIRQDVRLPVTALQLDQRSLITDIEFTSDGNIALLGEMSTGNSAFRFTTSESRFTKGSHNAIAREYRFDGSAWSLNEEYHVGNTYSGYNNTGGADFGYGNSENPEAYYDAAVLTGDYIEGSGFVYGIQVSPLSQGNYPTNTPYNHYIIDDNTTVLGLFVEKTGIGDVDVFSGVDYPAQDIVLALGVITQPTDCTTPDGIITITGEGLLPNTPYPVTYVKDGGAPVSASIVSNASGIIEITGLPPGAYTGIQINDPPTYTSNILSTTLTCSVSLSGTVFNDVNGLNPTPTNTVDGTPIQSPSGTALHANLFTDAGAFVATTPIDGSGNYVFNNVTPSSTYIVTISTTPAAAGSTPAGSVGLPPTWFNTGENVGLTAGSDGTVDGILQAVVATVDLPNVNFGIEQGPETAVNLQASQPNPGGTTSVTVPANAFVTSNVGTNPNTGDTAPGAVTGVIITGFPSNATSITIDGNVYTELTGITDDYPQGIPTDATGQPTVTIQVDPADGAVSVVIPIAAIDAAGVQDATPGSITLPFTVVAPISLSGTVFNDVNGLNPTPTNTVDGVPIQSPSGTALHANLFTDAGAFVATTPIDGSGNYVFNNVAPSSTYIVTISITPAAAGSTPAGSVGLPATWFNTGENVGLTAGSDGTVDGILQAVVATVDLPNVNFGIEQGPETAVNLQASQPNPGGATSVTVPANAFVTSNVGTNPNTGDPAPGAVTGIIITGFPSNATSITIDGNVYTELTGITDDYPQGIPTDASGQPTVTIQVDPADGAVSVVIPITAIDAAGVQDATPGSITLPFTVIAPISLSGTIFNDVNGLNPTPTNTVDGVPIQSPSGTPLHANLFTEAGAFVATIPIDGSGNYVFNNVTPSSTYIVTISTTPAAAGSTPAGSVGLPANWVNTGENVGLTAGSDGTVNGILQAVVATVDLPNVNFGIQQLPESEDHSAALPDQPAADAMIPLDGVLAPALSGSDPEDHSGGGSLENRTILITSLPTNGELWYNGTQITVGDDGVNPVSVINPFTITNLVLSDLEIKLTGSGYTSTSFTYAHVDGAGFPDPTPATYTLTWEDPLPVKLVSFTASKEGDVVQLVWTTSEESNSEYFEIQRSADGKDWKPLSRVNSAGESSQIRHYDYTDANPQPGQNLYRLKMVDKDADGRPNSFAFSGIRSVSFEQVFSAVLSPNPTSDVLKITTANWQLVKAVKIYDAAGKLVYNSGNKPEKQINVRGLVSGMHVVMIEQIDGASHAQRIVIIK